MSNAPANAFHRLRQPSIGIHIPAVAADGLQSRDAYVGFIQACETLGYDALWVEDRILHPAHLADPLVLLTLAAAHTERMLLGSAVLALNLRQAPVLARQLATLNHFSNGRLVVGLGIGGRPNEYRALNIEPRQRVRRFNENLTVLRDLLGGQAVDYEGRWYHLEQAIVRPAARVPFLFGAIVDSALRRAGRLGDGWIMAPFGSVDDFRQGWDLVQSAALKAGRDPITLTTGRLLYVSVDDDPERARAPLAHFLHSYYGDSGVVQVDRDAIFGNPAKVSAELKSQVQAGISHLILGVPSLDLTHLRRLAEDVLPAVRDYTITSA